MKVIKRGNSNFVFSYASHPEEYIYEVADVENINQMIPEILIAIKTARI